MTKERGLELHRGKAPVGFFYVHNAIDLCKRKELSEPRTQGKEKDMLVVAVERTRENPRSLAE